MKQEIFKNNSVYFLAIFYSILIIALFTLSNDNKRFLESSSKSIAEYLYFFLNNAVSAFFIISIYFLIKRKLISVLFLKIATVFFSFTMLYLFLAILKSQIIDFSLVIFAITLIINGAFLYIINMFSVRKSKSDEIDEIVRSKF